MRLIRTSGSSNKTWAAVVGLARSCLSAPSYAIFSTLLTGWALAPGRRTITAMICAADPEGQRAHDAYHRFVRAARWSTNALWRVLVIHMVDVLTPTGKLVLDCDDTLYKKSGRKVDGAGSFHDAVRSTRRKVVYATGLNLVVVTLRSLVAGAVEHIDVLAYAATWLWDAVPRFADTLVAKLEAGCDIRVCLGDPDSAAVALRGEEEGIGDAMAARCRLALTYAGPLARAQPGAVRHSDRVLYASLLRFDDEVLVNTHLWGNPAACSPVLHLRRAGDNGMAAAAMGSFERVWAAAQPVAA